MLQCYQRSRGSASLRWSPAVYLHPSSCVAASMHCRVVVVAGDSLTYEGFFPSLVCQVSGEGRVPGRAGCSGFRCSGVQGRVLGLLESSKLCQGDGMAQWKSLTGYSATVPLGFGLWLAHVRGPPPLPPTYDPKNKGNLSISPLAYASICSSFASFGA